jgi:succinoglycan biosynthesis protein ExoM
MNRPVPQGESLHPAGAPPHIAVCICTFRRPELLRRLLHELQGQETGGEFTYSAVVVDNDSLRSAAPIVAAHAQNSPMPVSYHAEARQNIAMARNCAVENANGDFVAFIDDDEFPTPTWLRTLFDACAKYQADGVLGPVKPHFDQQPPAWVVKGKFYERATYTTGYVIDWRKGRTGNVLLKACLFAGDPRPFDPEFRTGEDQEFFRRMIEKGRRFVWCEEAVAYEVVPPSRWSRRFMLRRALLRGAIEPKTAGFGPRSVLRSAVAVPLYLAAMPFALAAGQDRLMGLLVPLCDHLGKLLAVLHINPVKEPYVTS